MLGGVYFERDILANAQVVRLGARIPSEKLRVRGQRAGSVLASMFIQDSMK